MSHSARKKYTFLVTMMADAETLGFYEEERIANEIHQKWASDHDSDRVRRRYRPRKRSKYRTPKNEKCSDVVEYDATTVVFETKLKTADECTQTIVDWIVITAEPEVSKRSFWSWLGF